MQRRIILICIAAAALTLALVQVTVASAGHANTHVVFVQTNQPSGNAVISYDVVGKGHLRRAGVFPTGGKGGIAAPGSEPDHLASQGSLVYDRARDVLIAVNAGSDTVSTFHVDGDQLTLENVVGSGGEFPASITVRGSLVYVLSSGGTGVVQGFRLTDEGLSPIAGSTRSLGLSNSNPPNFLTSPGEVGFTPSGSQLLVTTKASTNALDVFAVASDGTLSAAPVANPSATPVPFAFTFTPSGRLAVAEAGQAVLSTYVVNGDGTLAGAQSLSDGQMAMCWIQRVGAYYYVSNTGSANVSADTISATGTPSLLGDVAGTAPGPIDQISPPGTNLLYVESGSGSLAAFQSNTDGRLRAVETITSLPAGIQGIASS